MAYSTAISLCISISACGDGDKEPFTPTPPPATETPDEPDDPAFESTGFAKGADVSWLTELEDKGCKFYNSKDKETECMQLLRDECGVNAIR
ncbi:MAG: glycosyl hydrolase 53 family protein, partial [Muribaculaceae bacterium]|nr:glycosyl hydrolase 53 family protein [Muribaculaceae bacterium]